MPGQKGVINIHYIVLDLEWNQNPFEKENIEINSKDAEERGIINGEVVRAFSRRGEIAIPARVTDDIREGIVNIPMHFVECAANVLTNSDSFDPKSKMVELKACAIEVEKLPEKLEMKGEVPPPLLRP